MSRKHWVHQPSHRLNRCLGLCDEPFKARNRFQGGATLASSNHERMLQLAGVMGACMRVNVLVEPMHRGKSRRLAAYVFSTPMPTLALRCLRRH